MKHIPTHLLPALALLALGGCATSSGLTTTEPDGIYYSSKDRTSEVATASTVDGPSDYAATDDPNAVVNPDYQDGSTRTRGSASDEYYDDDFDYQYYARRRNYSGLGMSYGLSYATPYWYAPTFAYDPFYSYSPYGYSAWNDPFYGPSWYGPSVSINFGFGGWGPWGGYGYGYRPWSRWGYGGYGNGYWDGYYSGLYGNGYYGSGYGYGGYWNGYRSGGRGVNYRVAPRRDRSVEVVGASNGGYNNGGGRPRVEENTGGRANNSTGTNGRYSRGRVESVGSPASGGGRQQAVSEQATQAGATGRGRLYRIVDNQAAAETNPTGGVRPVPQGASEAMTQPGQVRPERSRRFYSEQQPTPAPSGDGQTQDATPQYTRPRRERYADNTQSPQPQQYQQPTRRERTAEPNPSYQQPTRSYEAPTRSYDGGGRSYDGGGRSSGSSSGGGNSGGGGRGRVQ